MAIHALKRTSPGGEPFRGTCVRCGQTGLCLEQVWELCANTAGLSDEDAIMEALGLSNANEVSKIDTSDIPEVGEEWFKKAKLRLPEA